MVVPTLLENGTRNHSIIDTVRNLSMAVRAGVIMIYQHWSVCILNMINIWVLGYSFYAIFGKATMQFSIIYSNKDPMNPNLHYFCVECPLQFQLHPVTCNRNIPIKCHVRYHTYISDFRAVVYLSKRFLIHDKWYESFPCWNSPLLY